MSEEQAPLTQPAGSLEPPRTPPPTAVAASTPSPEPLSGPVRWLPERRPLNLAAYIDRALDVLDRIGDTVREAFVTR